MGVGRKSGRKAAALGAERTPQELYRAKASAAASAAREGAWPHSRPKLWATRALPNFLWGLGELEALRSKGGVAGAPAGLLGPMEGERGNPSPRGTSAVSRGETSGVDRFLSFGICIPRGSEDKEGAAGARRMLSGTHRPQTCSVPQPLLSLLSEAARAQTPGRANTGERVST